MNGVSNLLESNWGVFQGSRFRTQQNINLSSGNIAAGNVSSYYQRDPLNRTLNGSLKKKKDSDP